MSPAALASLSAPTGSRAEARGGAPGLARGAEPALAGLCLAVLGGLAGVAAWRGQAVAWGDLAATLAPPLGLAAIGLYVRAAKGRERLASLLVALGFYGAFGNLVACAIYLRFPLEAPPIDPLLARLDASLGYDWAAGVAWLAAHPAAGLALALVYHSALWQLLAVLAVLALSGRLLDLHRFLLVGALSLLLVAAVWAAAPSLGPSTLTAIPPDVAAAAGLVVDGAYAAELLRLAREGVAVLSPDGLIGTIAFPSYHLVMAALATWFARGTALIWAAVPLNLAMVPATMLQGGHHAVDLVAGAAVFALALAAVGRLLPAGAPPAP